MDVNNECSDAGLLLNVFSEPSRKKLIGTRKNKQETEYEDGISVPCVPSKVKEKFKPNEISKVRQISKKNLFREGDARLQAPHLEKHHSSLLFTCNPEIPPLKLLPLCGRKEPLFSKKIFADLNLHPHLVSCLQNRLSVVKLTEVQEKTIPMLLENRDALVKSCTGSGKTLAYAIPIVQKLQEKRPKIQRSNGLFALIIVPTRELAIQSFECFATLTNAFTWIVPGCLMGGEKKKSEKARIRKGLNILISTPGRLLDHLEHTSNLCLDNIQWLVIDEADRLLEQGFEESVLKIVNKCHTERQTVLLSATLSKGVESLAGISMTKPVYVDASSTIEESQLEGLVLPAHLKQFIVMVPSKLRLISLSAFILDNCLKQNFKALVFMCTQSCVDFHFTLLTHVLATMLKNKGHKCKFFKLHGNMKQDERVEIFKSFRKAKDGVLICTDVAARGLDLPHVDWIVQYSAPPSMENYVHRVGRTARIGKRGNSLLFLLPSENDFLQLLQKNKIQLDEIPIKNLLQPLLLIADLLQETIKMVQSVEIHATTLQSKYEEAVYSADTLYQTAKDAFSSYVKSYKSYPKDVRFALPFKSLHLGHVAKSFCLRESPSAFRSKSHGSRHSGSHDRAQQRIPMKRKQSDLISEYDSGLNALKTMSAKPFKKRKS